MKELTQHTVRCPLEERYATVAVWTDPDGAPSRRHLDVTACSVRPSTSCIPPARRAYFTDLTPLVSFVCDVAATPRHSTGVVCAKPCLRVLNAAEPGAESVRCTSGVCDGVELIRQTTNPTVSRLLWLHGV